ncbi:hypothetical protein F4775DRAFT_576032 [Biscogniauxia sp. FL1348]|nr:hypothetical protein F4775DRAFT_576032 [Biscogniauxia sp. FL1348]
MYFIPILAIAAGLLTHASAQFMPPGWFTYNKDFPPTIAIYTDTPVECPTDWPKDRGIIEDVQVCEFVPSRGSQW